MKPDSIPGYLFLGFSIASIGGPMAIAFVYLFYSITIPTYAFAASIGAFALFLFPMAVWLRYSERISSSGGLYSFAKEAAGERYAFVQGIIWIFSYFLYLPYTVTYVTYFIFGPLFGYSSILPVIEIVVPVLISGVMIMDKRLSLALVSVVALAQVIGVAYFGAAALTAKGLPAGLIQQGMNIPAFIKQSGIVALLFICADLPLFLGGEVEGRGRSLRKLLVIAFVIVALLVSLSALALFRIGTGLQANEDTSLLAALRPAYGNGIADVIAILSILSIIALITAEYFALSRLLHSVFRVKIRKAIAYIAVMFVGLDIISLADPVKFYSYLVFPSLIALYVSQLMVFVVYPYFARKRLALSAFDILIAAVSTLLMVYGLYSAIAGGLPY